jgi:hypothetical protein
VTHCCRRRILWLSLAWAALLALALGAAPAAEAEDLPVPELTLTGVPLTVPYGQTVRLSGALTGGGVPLPGATLSLTRQWAGEPEPVPLNDLTTDPAAGTFVRDLRPSRTTTYRVGYAGDATWGPATAEFTVSVKPRVTMSATTPVYPGWTVVFSPRVTPAHPGSQVRLMRKVDSVWQDWKTLTLGADSRGRLVWRPEHKGLFSFKAVLDAHEDHVAAGSSARRVTVKDGNPYGIPRRPAHFIVVDRSQYKLYYHEHGRIVRIFKCVLGKASTPTPLVRSRIWQRVVGMWGPYGPYTLWYYGHYGIHGTNEPWLLDRFPRGYSHGCTRVSNTNIRWLWRRTPIGTPVWNVP